MIRIARPLPTETKPFPAKLVVPLEKEQTSGTACSYVSFCELHLQVRRMRPGPRIYNIFPLLAGPLTHWDAHLDRIAEMGFDWIFINSFHEPGFSGSLYAVKDYFRLNPLLRSDGQHSDERLISGLVTSAGERGLSVMMDLVINHTSRDNPLVFEHPSWFVRKPDGSLRSPGIRDPNNPALFTEWGDLAEIDYESSAGAEILSYWQQVVQHHLSLGIRGFRGDAAYKIPSSVWRPLIETTRAEESRAVFFAETLGCSPSEVLALNDSGFDFLFNSSKWWDFRAPWLLEQYALYRTVAPSISFPESHDSARLISDLQAADVVDIRRIEAIYRQRYLFAASFSTGVMMPMGYEFGFRRKLDVVKTRASDWEEAAFDLSEFIADSNRMKASSPALNEEGPQQLIETDTAGVVGLLRSTVNSEAWALAAINADLVRPHVVPAHSLINEERLGSVRELTPGRQVDGLGEHTSFHLRAADLRVFTWDRNAPDVRNKQRLGEPPHGSFSNRVVIQNLYPELDGGRYPVKREAGDLLEVWADIFMEGHEKLAAVLRYRKWDEASWREIPMELVNAGLDRWRGAIQLETNTRYRYTIQAWHDEYASWLDEIRKKRQAKVDIRLELIEGRAVVAAALCQSGPIADRSRLERVLKQFDGCQDVDQRFSSLTSMATQRAMARLADRTKAVTYERELEVIVDRVQARYAAWYEMFPRSQGRDPTRSATFADAASRLGDIRDMGFDVVYLVPIHPIGRAFRKGKNNTLDAGPDDPGSPYAIGSAEGGHTTVHPDLGTLDDFRSFVSSARQLGMEVALDFAIQASPDHPWLKEHPDWFSYRPDGTIKYAENPPKKYQDIVNVNFFGGHQKALWTALRDVILFWVKQGVKIFRVDNPHTKPIPFWEWLIRTVQYDHPEVLFLSESFTRPPMLHMMAKIGFSQSYTYFTWRTGKSELTEYFTGLTQSASSEYLRPNLFPNTPDILPKILQTGGRPAFQIRFVLAATLSGTYGIYSGFELCEGRALPNSEEYLDSEKYEYRVRDWDAPGNIKDYIKAINRIREENPALHQLRNLRFYEASDDNILFYGKTTDARDNTVLIAVNLDPFASHEAMLQFPLADLNIADDEEFIVENLFTGSRQYWRGGRHHIRLDPLVNPAVFLRVTSIAEAKRLDSELTEGPPRHLIQSWSLAEYVTPRRWFAAKNERIRSAEYQSIAELNIPGDRALIGTVTTSYESGGEGQQYALPLTVDWTDAEHADEAGLIARVRRGSKTGLLRDAMDDDDFIRSLIEKIREGNIMPAEAGGRLIYSSTAAFPRAYDIEHAPIKRLGAEQSNTSVRVGSRMVLKLLRRIQDGVHPEVEIARYLTEEAQFANAPALFGSLIYETGRGGHQALAVLNEFIENKGDAWSWTMAHLAQSAANPEGKVGDRRSAMAEYLRRVCVLGQRTAELHKALAMPTHNAAFAPEEVTTNDRNRWVRQVQIQARTTLDSLARIQGQLGNTDRQLAAQLLQKRNMLDAVVARLMPESLDLVKTRIHGDFHLGQVLVTEDDFFLVDFEGEPSRPVHERRAKQSPVRDVVGMLRSFEYAAATLRRGSEGGQSAPWVDQWAKDARMNFLSGYRDAIADCPSYPRDQATQEDLLCFFILEKALYEIRYEAANRPGWLGIPLQGVLDLLKPKDENAK